MKDDGDDLDPYTIEVNIPDEMNTEQTNKDDYETINSFIPKYTPREPVDIGETENTPEWLVYQVNKMRKRADKVNDFLDLYNRFMEEDWEETPSEVEGFLKHHGYEEQNEDPLKWLAEEAATRAAKLCEKRDLVMDNYYGIAEPTPIRGGGKREKIESKNREKIQSEITYASQILNEVKGAGATTEGGWTEPHPSVGVNPEHSLGHKYRQELEKAAEDVDWYIERTAHWD